MTIDMSQGVPGLVVDGQQRLTALSEVDRDFQVFVSALICRDEAELRRQFVLINNTKPLPKSLIYELLPSVNDLPPRLSRRSVAADLTARLNFEHTALQGYIKQHTQPDGIIADTVVQKIIMESLTNGVMRELIDTPRGRDRCVRLVSNFFEAVKKVFPEAWHGRTSSPTTSIPLCSQWYAAACGTVHGKPYPSNPRYLTRSPRPRPLPQATCSDAGTASSAANRPVIRWPARISR